MQAFIIKMKKILITVASALFIILLWQIFALIINSPLILPSFFKVLQDFSSLLKTELFYRQLAFTFLRVIIAFFISIFAGTIIGFLCGRFETVRAFLAFPLVILRVTPVVALVLILVFSLSSSAVPVVASILMTLPMIVTGISEGVEHSIKDSKMNEMTRVFDFTKKQKIKYLLIPQLKPYIKSALVSSFGMSWKVVAAGEVLSLPQFALGSALAKAQVHLETSFVLAYTLALIILSYFFELILKFLCREKDSNQSLGKAGKPNPEEYMPQFIENEKLALIAPSGFGKTTLLDYFSQFFDEASYCFQENRLMNECTVFENIIIPLLNKYDEITARKKTDYYIEKMYLTEKKNVKVKFLSGGQKQRVALARALAFPSRILLLDESFNSQDYKLKMQLMDFIKQELTDAPKTLIFVTHDERDGKYLCDRIVYLDKAMSQE